MGQGLAARAEQLQGSRDLESIVPVARGVERGTIQIGVSEGHGKG